MSLNPTSANKMRLTTLSKARGLKPDRFYLEVETEETINEINLLGYLRKLEYNYDFNISYIHFFLLNNCNYIEQSIIETLIKIDWCNDQ